MRARTWEVLFLRLIGIGIGSMSIFMFIVPAPLFALLLAFLLAGNEAVEDTARFGGIGSWYAFASSGDGTKLAAGQNPNDDPNGQIFTSANSGVDWVVQNV